MRTSPSSLLPVLAGALVPKCPLCLAVYLSALGTGASAAHEVAPLAVHAGNALTVIALGFLGPRVVATRRVGMIALFTLSAGALLVLAWALPLLLWPRLVALAGVTLSVVRARRMTHCTSARAPRSNDLHATVPEGRQAGFTTRLQKRLVYHRLRRE